MKRGGKKWSWRKRGGGGNGEMEGVEEREGKVQRGGGKK